MKERRIPADLVHKFTHDTLLAAGISPETAKPTADGLWVTSIRGTDSHGVRLLPHYVASAYGGRINKTPDISYQQSMPTTGMVDADHGFGHAAGVRAMSEAIALAKRSGAGFVSVRNSSHCGGMAYFALEACKHDMIGLAFTHASPKVITPGSIRSSFGINPICFTAPMADEAPFVYDSAPTALTSNRLKIFAESNTPLPKGIAADDDGNVTTDATKAMQLIPIGGYKGFGLSMIVDILCGLLSGMPTGADVSKMYLDSLTQRRYLGQFYGAISIEGFEKPDVFRRRLQETCNKLRNEPWIGEGDKPMAPGDPEKAAEADRLANGIPFPGIQLQQLDDCATELGLAPLSALAGIC